MRLTPAFDDSAGLALLRSVTAQRDAAWPGTPATDIEVTTNWPAYRLPDDSALKNTLATAAQQACFLPAVKIAGPSNIGNYLAGLGIPATAGFGVVYEGLHGTDKRVRTDSIPGIHAAYHQACMTLLDPL